MTHTNQITSTVRATRILAAFIAIGPWRLTNYSEACCAVMVGDQFNQEGVDADIAVNRGVPLSMRRQQAFLTACKHYIDDIH